MANTAKILEGQTLLDWCLVNTGVVSSLFDVITLNALTSIEVEPGMILQIPPVVKQNVVDFFAEKQITTGIVEEITGGFEGTTVTIELLNSLDSVLSTQAFSIGSGTQQIVAPDTTITLNSGAFQILPSGINLDVELKDHVGATLTPISVVDNVISVNTEAGAALLPSGTYTPVESGSDSFDLLWENQTANVITSNGIIESLVSSSFSEGGTFKVNHCGDFDLNFSLTAENLICGVCYYKDNDLEYNTYIGIDHSILFQSGYFFVFGNGYSHSQQLVGSIASRFTLSRIGNVMIYKVDGTIVYNQPLDFSNAFLFNCSMGAIGSIYDIELIIP